MEMVILQRVTKFLHFVSSLFGCLFIYLFIFYNNDDLTYITN